MHAAGLFTALLMGASTVSAFALVPRVGTAVKTVILWNGKNQQGNDTNGNELEPPSYSISVSDGPGSCFDLNDLPINNQTTSMSVPSKFICTCYDNLGCTGPSSSEVYSPGINDFGEQGFDNKCSSVKCRKPRA